MKVIFDRLKIGENYNITAKDIKALLKIIPELSKGIKIVHVQNQEPHKTRFPRPVRFELLSHQLNISVKDLNKELIIKEILIELISKNGDDNTLRPQSYRSLTKDQLRRISELSEPIISNFQKIINK